MRHVLRRITLLSAALLILAVPVMAEEGSAGIVMDPEQQGAKNECLLVAMNCDQQVDTIHQRIDRIQIEINKGSDVYTNDELKRLQRQLDDATRNLDDLTGA